jgi:hypothetical protein
VTAGLLTTIVAAATITAMSDSRLLKGPRANCGAQIRFDRAFSYDESCFARP